MGSPVFNYQVFGCYLFIEAFSPLKLDEFRLIVVHKFDDLLFIEEASEVCIKLLIADFIFMGFGIDYLFYGMILIFALLELLLLLCLGLLLLVLMLCRY
jgi:hypothetical protein